MKRQITFILVLVTVTWGQLFAQNQITVNANSYDISDNLDLEAVAYLFGESKNLEVFEKKLNDPELQISNLDLNNDGYIDYLRVIELKKGRVSVVIIQAVLGRDQYQDVATIDVEVKNKKTVYVQVVGNEYIYGTNYIIEPVYVHRPIIFDFFWHPRRVVWHSPYYWNYYPVYYSHRNPRAVYVYHHHVYEHYHHRMHCRYVPARKIHTAVVLHKTVYRNDYAKSQPNKSFAERNKGFENRQELNTRRSSRPNMKTGTNSMKAVESNNRRVQPEMKSSTKGTRSGQRTPEKSVTVPADQSRSKSAPVATDRRYTRPVSTTGSGNVTRTENSRTVNKSASGTVPARTNTQTERGERVYRAPAQNSASSTVKTNTREKSISVKTNRQTPSSTRSSSPSVSTTRQIATPSTRNKAKQTTRSNSETRQSAPAPKAASVNTVRTAAPQNKSVSRKATSSSPKSSTAPARSSTVKPSAKSKKTDSKPARSSSEKPSEQSRSASRR